MLVSVSDAQALIRAGNPLLLAGSASALSQLPRGNWIAGTIPYFMDSNGGLCSDSLIHVDQLPNSSSVSIRDYNSHTIPGICQDAPEHGVTFLVVPSQSTVHSDYAQNAPAYSGMFLKPVVGWVAGVHLSDLGKEAPQTFNGATGKSSETDAVALHLPLPAGKVAEVDIVNIFEPGAAEPVSFSDSGFHAHDCLVQGRRRPFAEYISQNGIDSKLPLMADYNGTFVNVGIQKIDPDGTVSFFAPVFTGVRYRFAAPVSDYVAAFDSALARVDQGSGSFACNCILNYVYGQLEGKRTGTITGPMTFGEIAYQLLNQTLVRLRIKDAG
jgi:hypothetical protein